MSPFTRRNALAEARMRATRLHQRMSTPMDRPVDVFALTQRLGVWLAAQPMDSTYGFYLHDNAAAGIVVNSRHPEVLQRYTCAHELGHHLLGHGSHTDDQDTVEAGAEVAVREHQAQAFAAALLMPGPLVNHTLRRLGAAADPTAGDIYLASRDLAVSYTAMVWGLADLNKLDRRAAATLSQTGVRRAKDALRGGPAIADARADLWTLNLALELGTEVTRSLTCRVGDEIHIRVPEDLGTGYTWSLGDPPARPARDSVASAPRLRWDGGSQIDVAPATAAPTGPGLPPAGLDLLAEFHSHQEHFTEPAQDDEHDGQFGLFADQDQDLVLPGPGTRIFVVSPGTSGRHTLQLRLRREWEPTVAPMAMCRVTVSAAPRRTLPDQGLAPEQNGRRVQELAAA
ncbi:ImmA/IrrE family metallo-endopeptidase [Nocardia sp. X0981]